MPDLANNTDPAFRYSLVIEAVFDEVVRARSEHAPMRGAHDGHALILQEVHGLWGAIKDRRCDAQEMRDRAIQVAAMAVAFVVEVCDA